MSVNIHLMYLSTFHRNIIYHTIVIIMRTQYSHVYLFTSFCLVLYLFEVSRGIDQKIADLQYVLYKCYDFLSMYSGTCAIRHLSCPTSCTIRHISMVPWCVGLDMFHCIYIRTRYCLMF